MTDIPKNLLDQIKEFEDVFTVDRQKLKEVVAHFMKELEKGNPRFCRSGSFRDTNFYLSIQV
jgi:hexokinase